MQNPIKLLDDFRHFLETNYKLYRFVRVIHQETRWCLTCPILAILQSRLACFSIELSNGLVNKVMDRIHWLFLKHRS